MVVPPKAIGNWAVMYDMDGWIEGREARVCPFHMHACIPYHTNRCRCRGEGDDDGNCDTWFWGKEGKRSPSTLVCMYVVVAHMLKYGKVVKSLPPPEILLSNAFPPPETVAAEEKSSAGIIVPLPPPPTPEI